MTTHPLCRPDPSPSTKNSLPGGRPVETARGLSTGGTGGEDGGRRKFVVSGPPGRSLRVESAKVSGLQFSVPRPVETRILPGEGPKYTGVHHLPLSCLRETTEFISATRLVLLGWKY